MAMGEEPATSREHDQELPLTVVTIVLLLSVWLATGA